MPNQYSDDARHEIITALNKVLADTAIVYYKTHAFHWNVEGANFYGLHIMFEKFYTKLWKSMDEIAERIRALGEQAPMNYSELLKNAKIKEAETAPAAHLMVKILRDDYLALAKKAQDVCSFADVHGDLATTNMMTENATFLEKAAWMLKSTAND